MYRDLYVLYDVISKLNNEAIQSSIFAVTNFYHTVQPQGVTKGTTQLSRVILSKNIRISTKKQKICYDIKPILARNDKTNFKNLEKLHRKYNILDWKTVVW